VDGLVVAVAAHLEGDGPTLLLVAVDPQATAPPAVTRSSAPSRQPELAEGGSCSDLMKPWDIKVNALT
jgi:hypothetical protein